MTFWSGIGIGLFIGFFLGMAAVALAVTAGRAERTLRDDPAFRPLSGDRLPGIGAGWPGMAIRRADELDRTLGACALVMRGSGRRARRG